MVRKLTGSKSPSHTHRSVHLPPFLEEICRLSRPSRPDEGDAMFNSIASSISIISLNVRKSDSSKSLKNCHVVPLCFLSVC